ncbi:MAG: hypothetical protein RJA36_462 [Pseudomonadota bacterium]
MKTIIFCADGTWNGVNVDDDQDGVPDLTNVRHFFDALAGDYRKDQIHLQNEQETQLIKDGKTVQVAKYLHGVGDSRNPITKLFEGAVGAGVVQRIVRGYTFISRNYQPGDQIVLVGFSRGAYTARALGGLICSEGLLRENEYDWEEEHGREEAYSAGSLVWRRYRERAAKNLSSRVKLADALGNLPSWLRYLSGEKITTNEIDKIAAIGVWDTVGAMGIPRLDGQGRTVDAYRFADAVLNRKVQYGLHAIAADEKRMLFTPCLWEPREGVRQVLFAGAHADVGGGYPKKESELSKAPLRWMMTRLQDIVPLRFSEQLPIANPAALPLHDETSHPLFKGGAQWRTFSSSSQLRVHQSLQDRMNALKNYDPKHLAPSYFDPNKAVFSPIET